MSSTTIKKVPAAAVLAVLFLTPAFGFSLPGNAAADKINVVTTIPDLADMARAIGGDFVKAKSITKGSEDLHSVPMKPSYLLMLNKADMLFEMGLDSEHAWIPDLLYNCRNDRIQPGARGFVNCSARVSPLEVPDQPDRGEGDVHPEGNPHYNTDPFNGRLIALTVCDGLCRAYPEHAAAFRANLKRFLERFDQKLEEWKILARPLKGVKVITYHRSWSYFAKRFGLVVAGEIEPKPGIAPTPGYLAKLLGIIKREKVPVIIKEPFYSNRFPEFLHEKTGIKVVTLPNISGGTPETTGYFNFIEHNIKALLEALGKPVLSPEKIAAELAKEREGTGSAASAGKAPK